MRHPRVKIALTALALSVILAFAVLLSDAGQASALSMIATLQGFVEAHYWPGVAVYVVAFAVLISLTLPMATLFTVAGGFLFGAGIGSAAALGGMAAGAALTFCAMRLLGVREDSSALRHGRAEALFDIMDRNAVFYVMLLRIVPVAPCFAVNAGAAITRIDFPRFLLASLVGLAPSAFVYGSVGAGLDSLLEAREVVSIKLLLEPEIALPMLAVLALIGVSWLLRRHLPGLYPES
jgi:uncharacterized membrane protein YdjX (TVP38/TMEM64 family)